MHHPEAMELGNACNDLPNASHTLPKAGRRRRFPSRRLAAQVRTSSLVDDCVELNVFIRGINCSQVVSNAEVVSQLGNERA